MVKLINSVTGTEMWVADNRVDEYVAAGHTPAAAHEEKPIEKVNNEEELPVECYRKKRPIRKNEEK